MFNLRIYLTNAALACFDLTITALCYIAVRAATANVPIPANGFPYFEAATSLASVLVLWIALSSYFGMYRSRRLDSPIADAFVCFKIAAAIWVVGRIADAVLPAQWPPLHLTFSFVIANFSTLAIARALLRLCLRELRRRGYNVKHLVLIASEEFIERLEQKIAGRSHYGYRVKARLVYAGETGCDSTLLDQAREVLSTGPIDDVIIALPVHANALAARLLAECESLGVSVRIVPDLFPLVQADTQIYNFDGLPLVNARLYPAEFVGYVVIKRAFDLSIAVLALTLLSPLFLILSLLVRMTSPGPVFFTQERVGMNGKRFRMIKFRTMRQADTLDPDSHWTVTNDAYITRVGRWLRRTNLDELPQFFNVLKGEMSVVGPRPERPFFLERFRQEVPEYMARHYVKSGITGWAQVNGWRGDTPIPQRVAHDLYYIRNWDVSFDIKILFLTIARTFFPQTPPLTEGKHGSFRP